MMTKDIDNIVEYILNKNTYNNIYSFEYLSYNNVKRLITKYILLDNELNKYYNKNVEYYDVAIDMIEKYNIDVCDIIFAFYMYEYSYHISNIRSLRYANKISKSDMFKYSRYRFLFNLFRYKLEFIINTLFIIFKYSIENWLLYHSNNDFSYFYRGYVILINRSVFYYYNNDIENAFKHSNILTYDDINNFRYYLAIFDHSNIIDIIEDIKEYIDGCNCNDDIFIDIYDKVDEILENIYEVTNDYYDIDYSYFDTYNNIMNLYSDLLKIYEEYGDILSYYNDLYLKISDLLNEISSMNIEEYDDVYTIIKNIIYSGLYINGRYSDMFDLYETELQCLDEILINYYNIPINSEFAYKFIMFVGYMVINKMKYDYMFDNIFRSFDKIKKYYYKYDYLSITNNDDKINDSIVLLNTLIGIEHSGGDILEYLYEYIPLSIINELYTTTEIEYDIIYSINDNYCDLLGYDFYDELSNMDKFYEFLYDMLYIWI